MQNKFAEYVTSQTFNLSLTQPMIDAMIAQITGQTEGRYLGPYYAVSMEALERRGLVEYSHGDWTTTIAGWKVYDLIKLAGLYSNQRVQNQNVA